MASSGFPTGLFSYAGGTLDPSDDCTITLTVSVPDPPVPGSVFPNTTSPVDGKVGVLDVFGDPASDDLEVDVFEFTKSFDGPTTIGGTAVLTFTIENLDAVNPASGLAFSDDLDAVLSDLVAIALPAEPCGSGSGMAGISFLTLTGGNLPASGMCTFEVTVAVPGTASAGTFPNTSSELFQLGLPVADPAEADLTIVPPPAFGKAFSPSPIAFEAVSTITFTIDNSASALAASSLAFTDTLPAGVIVATPNGEASTCGGTVMAAPGGSSISLSGGTVGAFGSCTVSVDVMGSASGTHVNTSGDLTSSSGNSGPASDTLTVDPPLDFSKAFSPSSIAFEAVSTLTFTIDNSASAFAASSLAFTDTLPAGVIVATPNGEVSTCGGTVMAAPGGSSISLSGGTVGAGASCTVSVDVTGSASGTHVNTSGDLTSSSGNSGPASDTLTVDPPLSFSKAFSPSSIAFEADSTLTFTIDNSASAFAASSLAFTDTLPAGVIVATPNGEVSTCGGTVTAAPGGSSISLSGGTVGAGASCTVSVDVTGSASGTHVNTSGDLTSSSGNSGPASDTLMVALEPGTTCFTGPTATSSGEATICFSGGGPTCGFDAVGFIALEGEPLSSKPGNLVFPHGLVSFTISKCTPGFTAELTWDLPADSVTAFWKYGSTSADPAPHWYEFPATIDGDTITFSVTDGGLGDDDLIPDGTIIDPAGPAALDLSSLKEVPTLSHWSLIFLAVLIAAAGVWWLRRREAQV